MSQTHAHPENAAKPAPWLIPPGELMKIVGSPTVASFVSSGREFFTILRRHCDLKSTDRILDVGCGCGRMARPLVRFLTSGRYDGFDVVPELIAWCSGNISTQHPNFRFRHVDVANSFYYGKGVQKADQYRFPYDDGVFDIAILTSVFTHMLKNDVQQYAGEIARTLRPGGVALITFFLLNDESRHMKDSPRSLLRFPHRHAGDGILIESRERPEGAVAYPEDLARSLMTGAGLGVQQILFGSWCGRERTVSGQDIMIVRKADPHRAAHPPMETPEARKNRAGPWLRRLLPGRGDPAKK